MLDRAKEAALKPLDKAGDAALKTRAGDAIKQGMTTLLESIQQGAVDDHAPPRAIPQGV